MHWIIDCLTTLLFAPMLIIEWTTLYAAFSYSSICSLTLSLGSVPSTPNITPLIHPRNHINASPPAFNSITVTASIAIGAFAAFIAMVLVVRCKQRQHNARVQHSLKRPLLKIHPHPRAAYNPLSPRPLVVDTAFLSPIKPAYLDSPRPRRSSTPVAPMLVVNSPNSPTPSGNIPSPRQPNWNLSLHGRPIPRHVPSSVSPSRVSTAPHSRAGSGQFISHRETGGPHQRAHSHSYTSSSVAPEDLTELLNELSRHYVLKGER
ncbi:hypothetical protein R3P38DRAFT_2841233 [Favolaschia claudopus]|uniref:Transmembrane protein n=1 Tax=Favolaschia claudopus TaxID=2862362 RepID=A0AAW0E0Q2_9AGAR